MLDIKMCESHAHKGKNIKALWSINYDVPHNPAPVYACNDCRAIAMAQEGHLIASVLPYDPFAGVNMDHNAPDLLLTERLRRVRNRLQQIQWLSTGNSYEDDHVIADDLLIAVIQHMCNDLGLDKHGDDLITAYSAIDKSYSY